MGEISHLKAAVLQLKDQPFEILNVSLDDSRAEARRTIRTFQSPGIHVWDDVSSDASVAKLYNVQDLPAAFLLDADGTIRVRNPHGAELIAAIRKTLAGSTTSAAGG